jgi:hypothetical protein
MASRNVFSQIFPITVYLVVICINLQNVSAFNSVCTVSRNRFHSRSLVTRDESRILSAPRRTTREVTHLNLKTELTEEEIAQNEVEDNELIERLNAEILAESGVELDQLINPSKVVNLERDLVSLRKEILLMTNSEEIQQTQKVIDKKTATLTVERRGVMRGWLKNLFVGQSVLAGAGSLALVYQWVPTELPIQVLGFWMWWLFIIPSLR